MKHYAFLLALCLLLPLLSMGQTPTNIKNDTVILVWDIAPDDWPDGDDSIYYATREITFKDGRKQSKTDPIGDTITTVNNFKNVSLDEFRQTGQAMAISILRPEVVRASRVRHKALQGAGIGDLYALLDSIVWRTYLKEGVPSNVQDYTVEENGTPYGATMRRVANTGNVRLTFNGKNYRVILYAENLARVQDYPTNGQFIDLARTEERKWQTLSGISDGNKITPTLALIKSKQ